MVVMDGGDGWWRWMVEMDGGDGWWRWMVVMDGGDGGTTVGMYLVLLNPLKNSKDGKFYIVYILPKKMF